jgi:pimeloyl-ACP methyl ester carboxylesterase
LVRIVGFEEVAGALDRVPVGGRHRALLECFGDVGFDPLELGLVVDRAGLGALARYAPMAATVEKRVKEVATWCGTWDVLTDFSEFYPPLQQQFQWLLGASSDADAREKVKQFTLDGYARQISVPVCMLHGTDDVVMDLEGARRFVSALTVDDVTFEVYNGAGSLHCSYDYTAHAVSAPG